MIYRPLEAVSRQQAYNPETYRALRIFRTTKPVRKPQQLFELVLNERMLLMKRKMHLNTRA